MIGFDLLVGHLVGDYILQNDWMARNKKDRSLPCFVHCALYTLAVAAFSLFRVPLPWLAFVFVTHYAVDRSQVIAWWMKFNGQVSFARALAPWSSIVVDNVWHIVVLWIVAQFV